MRTSSFSRWVETLSVSDFNQIVKDLGATMVIPINYKTDLSGIVPLRTLDEYLSGRNFRCAKSIPTKSWSAAHASRRTDRLCPEVSMKILLLGSGGREHALAWRLRQDDPGLQLFTAPGNAGTGQLGTNLPLAPPISTACRVGAQGKAGPDVVGPEAPLCAGVVDRFEKPGCRSSARTPPPRGWKAARSSPRIFCSSTACRPRRARVSAIRLGLRLQPEAQRLSAGLEGRRPGRREGGHHRANPGRGGADHPPHHGRARFRRGGPRDGDRGIPARPRNVDPRADRRHLPFHPADCAGPQAARGGGFRPEHGRDGRVRPGAFRHGGVAGADFRQVVEPVLAAFRKEGSIFAASSTSALSGRRTARAFSNSTCAAAIPKPRCCCRSSTRRWSKFSRRCGNSGSASCPVRLNSNHAVTVVLAAAGYPGTPETGVPIEGLDLDLPGTGVFQAGQNRRASGS
jgi:phosphoribosylamine--glycine ligase